jgi:hypothetical protein
MPAVKVIAVVLAGLALSGCVAAAAAGAVVGVTGAVVGTGTKAVVATGKAIIPGESKADREKREYREWQAAKKKAGKKS